MDFFEYLRLASDQPHSPTLPCFEPHPLERPVFSREFERLLTGKLLEAGVSLPDLQCHKMQFWYPRAVDMDPLYLWIEKARWDAESTLFRQLRHMENDHEIRNVDWWGWRATELRGAEDMVRVLDRAISQQSCLAVWALAALVPIVKARGPIPDYLTTELQADNIRRDRYGRVEDFSVGPEERHLVGFTPEEAWDCASDLLGQRVTHASRVWDARHTQALPVTDPYRRSERSRRPPRQSLAVVDHLAAVIAATLRDYVPVVMHFVPQSPSVWVAEEMDRFKAANHT